MDIKDTVKLIAGAVVGGIGIGFLIGRREVYDMAAQCDSLIETNKRMRDEYEDLQMVNENLRVANRLKTELMLERAIAEIDDDIAKGFTNNELE